MELLKKISKNYLSISFSMLMTIVMALGVGSCECGKGGDTGNPSISFKKDTLIGNEKTTELVVGGAYMPGDFEIKVAVTNGSIKIHGHKLIDGDKKLLNEVLGSEDKVEEGKDLTVEVEPTDVTLAFEATVTILKKENGEAVNNAKINWNPGVTTGFEGKISDLVGDKVTVEIKLKEDGKEVAVEAGDVQDIEVIVVSNQNKPGESAMIAGLDANGKVKLQAGDIKAGILTKELQVTPGTKDTELTITVTSKGNEITGAKKKITVLAAATYTFEFNPKKIEDGATTVQVVLKKGNKDLVKVEVDKLKFKVVKRDKGTAATIAGKDPGQKIDLNVTLVNANKEATMNLVIDPKTDKSVTWELELEDENAVAIPRTKQTLDWENGAALTMAITYDATGKTVKATVTNLGKKKLDANQAKITWDTGSADVKIGGKQVSDVAVDVPQVAANGGTTDVALGTVAFNPGSISTMTVTLKWGELAADVVKTTALAESQYVVDAINARDEAARLKGAVATALAASGGDLAALKAGLVEFKKIAAEIQKIKKAQVDAGGANATIGTALTAAELSETQAKTAYEAVAKKLSKAAKDEAARLKGAVDTALAVSGGDLAALKAGLVEFKKIAAEIKAIKDVQTAVAGLAVIADLGTDLTAAELSETDAKTAYEAVAKKLSKAAKDEAARLKGAVDTALAVSGGDLAALKAGLVEFKKIAAEIKAIKDVQTAVAGLAVIADLGTDLTAAELSETDAKTAYEAVAKKLSKAAKDEAARLKGAVDTALAVSGGDLAALKAGLVEFKKIAAEIKAIKDVQTAVAGLAVIADLGTDLTAAELSETDAKTAYEAVAKKLSKAAKDEAARLKGEVDKEVLATKEVEAQAAYALIDAEIKKIDALVLAVNGLAVIADLGTDLTAAKKSETDAKTAYDNKFGTPLSRSKAAKDEAARLRGKVDTEVAKGTVTDLTAAIVEFNLIDTEIKKIEKAQVDAGGANATIGTDLTAAKKSETDAKTAYETLAKKLSKAAKDEAARLKGAVDTALAVSGGDLAALQAGLVEFKKIAAEIKAIKDVQTAVTGLAVIADLGTDLTAAELSETDAKTAYEAVAKKLSKAAKDEAARLKGAVDTALAVSGGDLAALQAGLVEFKKIAAEIKAIKDVQTAVTGLAVIADLGTDLTAAELSETDAKTAYEAVAKKLSKAAKDEAARLKGAVDTALAVSGGDLAALKAGLVEFKKIAAEIKAIKDVQTAVAGLAVIADLGTDLTAAELSETDAKTAYEAVAKKLSKAAKDEAARLKGEVDKEVLATKEVEAHTAYALIDAEIKKIDALVLAVNGLAVIADLGTDLTAAKKSETDAKTAGGTKGWVW